MNAKEKIEELLEASEDGTITAARDSGAGAGHGVRHLCRPQLPDELYRLFRRHCRHHAGGAGGVHADGAGERVGRRDAAAVGGAGAGG